MARQLTHELMDDPDVPKEHLARALGYIRSVNRNIGGVSALLGHLKRWSVNWPRDRPITLLDVATGSADLPLAARRWAEKAGFDLRVTGIDKHALTLEFAREHVQGADGIMLQHGDALQLDRDFDAGSFDYVHAGLFLHHLSDDHVAQVLRSMDRIARRGIIWNDLVRDWVASAAIWTLTIGKPRIVRHDARVSVRAGFTRQEALELGQRAGVQYAAYSWETLTRRFTLAGEKPGPSR
jgi:hypothetical protein